MSKIKKPIIEEKEIINEISNRTGLPFNVIFASVDTYFEIIKECINAKVEADMGELGVMSWKMNKPKKNVVYYNFVTGEKMPPTDVAGYYTPVFKPKRKWRLDLKSETEFWEEEKEK